MAGILLDAEYIYVASAYIRDDSNYEKGCVSVEAYNAFDAARYLEEAVNSKDIELRDIQGARLYIRQNKYPDGISELIAELKPALIQGRIVFNQIGIKNGKH